MLVRHVQRRHRDVVALGELADVSARERLSLGTAAQHAWTAMRSRRKGNLNLPRIGDSTAEVEAALGVKLVVDDPVRVSDQRGRLMLVLDELHKLIGAHARLVAEREALGEQLDEAQLERVAHEPGVSKQIPPPSEDSLERHGALDVASEVHDLLADGGDEGVRGVFLGKVVARNGEDEVGRLCRSGHAEHRAGEEDPVRLGCGEALELTSRGGVDLR